jgi:hypothetical protein
LPEISLVAERIVKDDIQAGTAFPGDKQQQFLKLPGMIVTIIFGFD